jgi:hypothetical protein
VEYLDILAIQAAIFKIVAMMNNFSSHTQLAGSKALFHSWNLQITTGQASPLASF